MKFATGVPGVVFTVIGDGADDTLVLVFVTTMLAGPGANPEGRRT